jgi:hypothetical protein
VFKDVAAATLAVGQFLDIKGLWQDGQLSAMRIERD